MKLIKTIYFDDVILQRFMKIKRLNKKRVFLNITKIEVKLKLVRCEIRDNFFWIKNKIYVSQNEKLYFVLIKLSHDFTMKNHANKKITYNRITRHYYWSKMTHTINRYVKICHQYKRTKTYRDAKQKLLNSLFISKKYFQNISMNFIMKLSKCVKNERIFEHIMIIMNKFFKKKSSSFWIR